MGYDVDYTYKPDIRPSVSVQRAIDVEASSDPDAICAAGGEKQLVYDGPDVAMPRAPEARKHPPSVRSRGKLT